MDAICYNWLLALPGLSAYMWTGLGDFEYDGNTYKGLGGIIEVGTANHGGRDRLRVSAVLGTTTTSWKTLTKDLHRQDIIVQGIAKLSTGWAPVPSLRHVGFLSNAVITSDGAYSAEVEPYGLATGLADPIRWTNADWKERYPGNEAFSLAEGLQSRLFSWPNN